MGDIGDYGWRIRTRCTPFMVRLARYKSSSSSVDLDETIEWDSLSAHEKFTQSPKSKELATLLIPVLEGPPSVYHCSMDDSLSEVLKAPVTEVLTLYQPGETIAEDLKDFVALLANAQGFYVGSAGAITEELQFAGVKMNAYQALAGWETVHAHMQAFKELGLGAKLPPAIQTAKGKEMHHVQFRRG